MICAQFCIYILKYVYMYILVKRKYHSRYIQYRKLEAEAETYNIGKAQARPSCCTTPSNQAGPLCGNQRPVWSIVPFSVSQPLLGQKYYVAVALALGIAGSKSLNSKMYLLQWIVKL
jgi:hypothetical protein